MDSRSQGSGAPETGHHIKSEDVPAQEPKSVPIKEEPQPSTTGTHLATNVKLEKEEPQPSTSGVFNLFDHAGESVNESCAHSSLQGFNCNHCGFTGNSDVRTPADWAQAKAYLAAGLPGHMHPCLCCVCAHHAACRSPEAASGRCFPCACCTYSSADISGLKEQSRRAGGGARTQKACGCTSAVPDLLKQKGRLSKLHTCSHCAHTSAGGRAVKSRKMAKQADGKIHSCPHCQYKSSRSRSLMQHLLDKHAGKGRQKCKSADLKKYLRAELNGKQLHSCPHCDYKAARPNSLKDHMAAKHGDRLLSCTYCGYKAAVLSALERHVAQAHTGRTPDSHKGPECEPAYVSTESTFAFVSTERTVTYMAKVKQYTCKYCVYKSDDVNALQNHMLAKHKSLKHYSCKYCTYRAAAPRYVKKHVMSKHKQAVENSSHVRIVSIN